MRFRHPDGSVVHLAYCSNVHPAEDVDGLARQLDRYAAPIRDSLGAPRLGVGLWLPAAAAAALAADPAALRRLRRRLDSHHLEVVTLNAFPYKGFHDPVVKGAVYHPDWTDPARAAYTLDAAGVLAGLLPDDVEEGSISTLPLAWREPWDETRSGDARRALLAVAGGLAELAAETGRYIRLALEPEPGCVLESSGQAAAFLSGLAPEWVGVCLDACHLAVGFEDPGEAAGRLAAARVAVHKAQVSRALRGDPATLAPFVEPRFLHQTRERAASELVLGVDDLDEAFAGGLPGAGEWRSHFHVPVHHEPAVGDDLARFLAVLVGGDHPLTRHLEVETYTWSVLPGPPAGDAGLVAGLAAELAWTRHRLSALGLEEIA
ncbi:MAG: metabolite traffic protein EboE [Acidimicrobiia bacterium]